MTSSAPADRAADTPQPSRPPLARRAHAPWSEVILLGGLSALGSVSMDMYLPALPTITRTLHTTPAAAQTTVSIFLLGLAFGQLVIGPLSDRIGRRPPILIGMGVYLLACVACAWAPTVGLMVPARLLQALGACAGMVVARAYVRDRYDDHEVLHVFSMLSLVFGVAPILAPLIGGWVLQLGSWRWIFGVQVLFALVAGGWAFLKLGETRSEATRLRASAERSLTSYGLLLSDPLLVGYLLSGALGGAALFAYITAGPDVVITHFGVAAQQFGWVFAVNAAGLIGGGQINARLARRIQSARILRYALIFALTAGAAMLGAAWTGFAGLWGVLVPLFFVITSLGFTQPNASVGALTVGRERAGAASALLGACFFGIGSIAGALTGALHDGTARPMALVVVAALALAVTVQETVVQPRLGRC